MRDREKKHNSNSKQLNHTNFSRRTIGHNGNIGISNISNFRGSVTHRSPDSSKPQLSKVIRAKKKTATYTYGNFKNWLKNNLKLLDRKMTLKELFLLYKAKTGQKLHKSNLSRNIYSLEKSGLIRIFKAEQLWILPISTQKRVITQKMVKSYSKNSNYSKMSKNKPQPNRNQTATKPQLSEVKQSISSLETHYQRKKAKLPHTHNISEFRDSEPTYKWKDMVKLLHTTHRIVFKIPYKGEFIHNKNTTYSGKLHNQPTTRFKYGTHTIEMHKNCIIIWIKDTYGITEIEQLERARGKAIKYLLEFSKKQGITIKNNDLSDILNSEHIVEDKQINALMKPFIEEDKEYCNSKLGLRVQGKTGSHPDKSEWYNHKEMETNLRAHERAITFRWILEDAPTHIREQNRISKIIQDDLASTVSTMKEMALEIREIKQLVKEGRK